LSFPDQVLDQGGGYQQQKDEDTDKEAFQDDLVPVPKAFDQIFHIEGLYF